MTCAHFLDRRDPQIYNLGTTFSLTSPIDVLLHNKNQRLLYTICAHAVIYNKKYMENALTREFMNGHTDFEMNRVFSKFTYTYPLAYQLFEDTENQKAETGLVRFVTNSIFKPLKLDIQVQPGFDRLKLTFDYISVAIFLVLLFFMRRRFLRK